MSETVTAVQPDKAAMEKINLYTRRAYKPEEVYTFSVVLCDNEVDRDGECFTKETLEELAKLFVGKTGILDHEPTSKNQTARVFDAAVKEIPGKVTSLNEPYAQLTAQAYVPRNDGTKAFIESIESGIRKEVSVGCAVKKRVCSVCGVKNPFGDIDAKGRHIYFTDAILWAAQQGITSGTSATTFEPEGPATRAQVVTFLYRANNIEK